MVKHSTIAPYLSTLIIFLVFTACHHAKLKNTKNNPVYHSSALRLSISFYLTIISFKYLNMQTDTHGQPCRLASVNNKDSIEGTHEKNYRIVVQYGPAFLFQEASVFCNYLCTKTYSYPIRI